MKPGTDLALLQSVTSPGRSEESLMHFHKTMDGSNCDHKQQQHRIHAYHSNSGNCNSNNSLSDNKNNSISCSSSIAINLTTEMNHSSSTNNSNNNNDHNQTALTNQTTASASEASSNPSLTAASASTTGNTQNGSLVSQFHSLKQRLDMGMISKEAYLKEKTLLLDSLTRTGANNSVQEAGAEGKKADPLKKFKSDRYGKKSTGAKGYGECPPIPPRDRKMRPKLPHDSLTNADINPHAYIPPVNAIVPNSVADEPEKALKHIFNPETHSWTSQIIQVRVQRELLEKNNGGRKAFHLQEISSSPNANMCMSYVAKVSVDKEDASLINAVCKSVEDRMYANQWAQKFNFCCPPKGVEFVDAWLLELIERKDRPLCAVEHFLAGHFKKYNDKHGLPSAAVDRNTPQAFSHFTFIASNRRLLICNIKGVGDLYTDPLICVRGKRSQNGDNSTTGGRKNREETSRKEGKGGRNVKSWPPVNGGPDIYDDESEEEDDKLGVIGEVHDYRNSEQANGKQYRVEKEDASAGMEQSEESFANGEEGGQSKFSTERETTDDGKDELRVIQNFIATHKCNSICRYLKLQPLNAIPCSNGKTVPATAHMSLDSVHVVANLVTKGNVPVVDMGSAWSCCNIL
eukprot:Nk52_evm10s305 gene=Nk52_evmTU10s305